MFIIIIFITKMKFYNRKNELEEIETLSKKKPSFLVITGRRRIGKTELMLHSISKAKNAFYFFVDDKKNEALLVQEYIEAMQKLGLPEFAKSISTMDAFISFLFDIAKKEEITAVFDEFQRFKKLNPSIINQFQKHLDTDKGRLFLLALGSSVGMIKHLFIEEQAPLFKRADNLITLLPFKFRQISEILKDLGIISFKERLKIYLLFGGIIYYYKLIEKYEVKSFNDALQKLLLREFAPLKSEVRDIFVEEFGKEHGTYYEILHAISAGKTTKKEMSDFVHVEESSLSPYLSDLKELLGAIEYAIPATEHEGSKKGRYVLTDSFFHFWFRFIYRNLSAYESGDYKALAAKIEEQIESFFGMEFERFCKELLSEHNLAGKLPIKFNKIGRWQGHYRDATGRKDLEIDLVAINEDTKEIMFVECKWQDKVNGDEIVSALKEKAKFVEWNKNKRKETYCIIAKGFGKRPKDALTIGIEDIEAEVK